MRVPVWLTFAIALVVMGFGLYRLWLSTRTPVVDPHTSQRRQRGMYAMSKRAHLVVGLLYVALGGVLIATALGYRPFRKAPPPAEPPLQYKTINLRDLPDPTPADAAPADATPADATDR